jgi:hypothetical protein
LDTGEDKNEEGSSNDYGNGDGNDWNNVGSVVIAPPYSKVSAEIKAEGKYYDGEEPDKPFEEPTTYQSTYQG